MNILHHPSNNELRTISRKRSTSRREDNGLWVINYDLDGDLGISLNTSEDVRPLQNNGDDQDARCEPTPITSVRNSLQKGERYLSLIAIQTNI